MDVLFNDTFASSLFLIGGFVLLFLEVFVPSGGVLGILAIACTAFAAYGFYSQGRSTIAIVSVAGFAGYGALMLWWIMKRVTFKGSMSATTSTSVDSRISVRLIGKQGVAVTALRPAGMALIDGQKVDVVSIGDFVDKDAAVEIIEVSGNRVVVKKLEGSTPA